MNSSKWALALIAIVSFAGIATAIGTWLYVDGQKLRVGYVRGDMNHAALIYAKAQGLYYNAGLDMKLVSYASEKAIMDALDAGALDMALVGLAAAVSHRQARGTDITALAAASVNGSAIVVLANSSINTVADLAGKTIAIPAVGLTQDLLLHAMLNGSGVKYGGATNQTDDVTITINDPAPMLEALNKSNVDAIVAWEALAATAVHNVEHGSFGYPGRYLANSSDTWPNHPSSVIVARSALLATPAWAGIITRFLHVHVMATNAINAGKLENPATSAFYITMERAMSIGEGDLVLSLKNTGFVYQPSIPRARSFIGNMTAFGLIGAMDVDAFLGVFFNTTLLDRALLL
ncbi:MAG: ABC transporter substrate-binding protein [Candidatus Lokiarchaeota archaeon]|nr:ABC transporter substrate-binding protein [Candidatus Lokiarchaeota archaeon]